MTKIEARLGAIYEAAHVSVPAQATLISNQGTAVSGATEAAVAQLALLGSPLSSDIWSLGEEVVFRLRQITTTLNASAVALDGIADDFAATDADAAQWLQQHARWLGDNGYGGDPDQAPVPDPVDPVQFGG
jgi:hypothetical protein